MSSADTDGSPTGSHRAPGSPGAIPPLDDRCPPTLSGVVRRPLFARDASPRLQPAPPAGPPPRRPPQGATEVPDLKLPGISAQTAATRLPGASSFVVASSPHEKEGTPEDLHDGRRLLDAPPLAVEMQHRPEPRLSTEIALAARKAQRVAEVRNIAQEVVRVSEGNANAVTDEKERGEIERALAAVDETRRKRMERQQAEQGVIQQDEEKLRRRQAKREQLMKKRKDMEERLKEEATKLAELTESAKKKGESKFMSEEAKRDAEERVRAEVEAMAELERQVADMITRREKMREKIATQESEKAAEIEATSTALKTKRALVEARMKQEEEEINSLSQAAKREVEAKMFAEAAAIAEMERQALQMSAKRAELQADMSKKLHLEDKMVQETRLIARKRAAIEAKIQQEEAELQKLSDAAKQRVLEKMAAEAAAIADMEREAGKLAEERAILASQIANQRALADAYSQGSHTHINLVDVSQQNDFEVEETRLPPEEAEPDLYGADASLESVPDGEGTFYEPTQDAFSAAGPRMSEIQDNPRLDMLAYAEEPEESGQSNSNAALVESLPVDDSPWNEQKALIPEEPPDLHVCAHCRIRQRDLSSAHLAAAAGHMPCLEAIQWTQRELLTEVDSSGRSSLFYACANAHADATDLLIQEEPQSCRQTDVNGDTPLHAAALAGSRLCCLLLIQHGQSEVEPRNQMQMTPAHLAANNEVLEVLSQHGASLNVKDVDMRTPLFLACASDRLEKAEFLCELLEYADEDLGEADKRGDTPMHAAAYNGSTACLLLLLQYGVEPDARNTKGLRPIDLASRRGHTACKKILMEYQLHHRVNNSYFDSVLFLATLEGLKRCKETLSNTKQEARTTSGAHAGSSLIRPESLMSLRRERSVRLEHWGDWIAYEDQNEKSILWYNHVEEKSQRDAPTGVCDASVGSLSKASMRLKRQGDWIEYTLPDGSVFYFNDKTNEFQWERPDEIPLCSVSQEWAGEEELCEDDIGMNNNDGDWTAFKDPSTGLIFWYNNVTDESQWEPPEGRGEIEGVEPASGADEGNYFTPEEDIREINDENDLFTS